MNRLKKNRLSRREYSPTILPGVVHAGVWAIAALALMSGHALAQQPSSPPAGGPPTGDSALGSPAGGSTTMSSDPKLLAPLPRASAEVLKQSPPSLEPRNLEGVWVSDPQPFPTGGFPQLPFTDTAKEYVVKRMERQRQADLQGKVLLTEAGRCRPMEGIGIGSELFPAEIIQTSDKLVILNEEGRGRWVIHLNGKHPQDLKSTHFGHSIGHWDNDTLVVDTVGLRHSEGAFGRAMRSDKARIVSHLRKSDDGLRLELILTLYDSETYTQPFEESKTLSTWHPEVALLEFQCEENLEGAREGMIE